MYYESGRVNLPEESRDKAIFDFFLAIETIDPIYSNSQQETRSGIEEQNKSFLKKVKQRTIDEMIIKFQNCFGL